MNISLDRSTWSCKFKGAPGRALRPRLPPQQAAKRSRWARCLMDCLEADRQTNKKTKNKTKNNKQKINKQTNKQTGGQDVLWIVWKLIIKDWQVLGNPLPIVIIITVLVIFIVGIIISIVNDWKFVRVSLKIGLLDIILDLLLWWQKALCNHFVWNRKLLYLNQTRFAPAVAIFKYSSGIPWYTCIQLEVGAQRAPVNS